jgi:hypothetical protein
MRVYKSKYAPIPGSSHAEVIRAARYEYHKIQKLTPRRQANVKSRYFRKDKVFINQFWEHLKQKHPRDQLRRAKLFVCAVELIRNTTANPDTVYSHDNQGVELHRFYGQTQSGMYFGVQIRENKRNKRKDFMSVFPVNKHE